MNQFTLLWSKILDSSVWQLSKESRLVWITMLAMKDKNGVVTAAIPGLAHRARVSVAECETALAELEAPDKYSGTPDNEGRRIKPVPGGWQILNHELYRSTPEAKKAQAALRQQKHRAKIPKSQEKPASGKYLAGEARALKKLAKGDVNGFEAECAAGTGPNT